MPRSPATLPNRPPEEALRLLRTPGLAVLLALASGVCVRTGQAANTTVAVGVLDTPNISGAAFIRGNRLLLAADEGQRVYLIEDAVARLRAGRVTPTPQESLVSGLEGKVRLDDLEDAAWDGARDAYLIGSHGREPRGETPEERYRVARLRFDAVGKLTEVRQSGGLLQAIVADVPFLADAIRRTPARAGLNIEGLAWHPDGALVVGLRAPTVTESTPRPHGGQEDAVILRIRNPQGLFAAPDTKADLADVEKLDLQGQGIRGMAYDPQRKAFWLLSGLSAEPTHPVRGPWALWLWDEKGSPRPARLPVGIELSDPEAVAWAELDGKPHLLLVEDGRPQCRYALLPASSLTWR